MVSDETDRQACIDAHADLHPPQDGVTMVPIDEVTIALKAEVKRAKETCRVREADNRVLSTENARLQESLAEERAELRKRPTQAEVAVVRAGIATNTSARREALAGVAELRQTVTNLRDTLEGRPCDYCSAEGGGRRSVCSSCLVDGDMDGRKLRADERGRVADHVQGRADLFNQWAKEASGAALRIVYEANAGHFVVLADQIRAMKDPA